MPSIRNDAAVETDLNRKMFSVLARHAEAGGGEAGDGRQVAAATIGGGLTGTQITQAWHGLNIDLIHDIPD
jgi:hypothetical protein